MCVFRVLQEYLYRPYAGGLELTAVQSRRHFQDSLALLGSQVIAFCDGLPLPSPGHRSGSASLGFLEQVGRHDWRSDDGSRHS